MLAEAAPSIETFFSGGVMEPKEKLGPINWQFMPSKALDRADFEAFLKLLPRSVNGVAIRHAVEVRYDSFRTPDFIALLGAYRVAAITAADSDYPQIADVTAPFVDARIMGPREEEDEGYSGVELDRWAQAARQWATGQVPANMEPVAREPAPAVAPDVFLSVISGAEIRNPAAAMALTRRLAEAVGGPSGVHGSDILADIDPSGIGQRCQPLGRYPHRAVRRPGGGHNLVESP